MLFRSGKSTEVDETHQTADGSSSPSFGGKIRSNEDVGLPRICVDYCDVAVSLRRWSAEWMWF